MFLESHFPSTYPLAPSRRPNNPQGQLLGGKGKNFKEGGGADHGPSTLLENLSPPPDERDNAGK